MSFKKITKKIEIFSSYIKESILKGTAQQMRGCILEEKCNLILEEEKIIEFISILGDLETKVVSFDDTVELTLFIYQLLENIRNREAEFKATYNWLKYCNLKESIDQRINLFNTTQRIIRTSKKKGKLVVDFPPASEMSNGERDVITFIVQISKFESEFTKHMGMLVIDEIFDYLDGSNMLIAQYYLSKMICDFKSKGKAFFPIILTHLDPYLFNNYYLKNMKVHYLKEFANTSNMKMINFLKLRTAKNQNPSIADKIEKGFIHFYDSDIEFEEEEKTKLPTEEFYSTEKFRNTINQHVQLYISDKVYDPIMVICAVRVKIEKEAYDYLEDEQDKIDFFVTHTTAKKLEFVENKTSKVPENFYLLAPLYNDALHMDLKNENSNRNKVKSICLKLDNLVVKKIVSEIFA